MSTLDDRDPRVQAEILWCGSSRIQTPSSSGWVSHPGLVICHHAGADGVIERESESAQTLKDGSVFCVGPNFRYRVTMPGRRTFVSTAACLHATVNPGLELSRFYRPPLVLPAATGDQVAALLAGMVKTSGEIPGIERGLRLMALCLNLLEVILPRCQRDPDIDRYLSGLKRLEPVMRFVRENLGGRLRREQLALVLGISPARLTILFRDGLGMAPMEWVARERMDNARRLLAGEDVPIAEIAQRTGFSSPYDFSRAFRKQVGMPPRRYRLDSRRNLASRFSPGASQNDKKP